MIQLPPTLRLEAGVFSQAYDKTSTAYPDGTAIIYTYDLLGRMINLHDAEGQDTVCGYDPASRLISESLPNGWNGEITYDAAGQLIAKSAYDPTNTTNKTIGHTYGYDPQGNVTSEMRTGAGGQKAYNLAHTYDALNRLIGTEDLGHNNDFPIYQYDSLGNRRGAGGLRSQRRR